MPDFKYISSEMAARYSNAPDYPEVAKRALAQMVKQTGDAKFDERDMMKRGVIVRHLILPGHIKESKEAIRYLYETYGDQIYISIMNQYTPMPGIEKRFKILAARSHRRNMMRLWTMQLIWVWKMDLYKKVRLQRKALFRSLMIQDYNG